jgi:hypothetical protein
VKENIFKRGSQIFKFIVNGWGVFFRGVSGVELSISVTRCRRSSSTPLAPVCATQRNAPGSTTGCLSACFSMNAVRSIALTTAIAKLRWKVA